MTGATMLRYCILASLLVSCIYGHDLLYKSHAPDSADDQLPDVVPISKKIPAFRLPKLLSLPNQKSLTSHGNTCKDSESKCALSNGQNGCCEFQNGTCCSDNMHCCPNGYRCNIKDNKCELPEHNRAFAVVCSDGQSQCPSGTTCCKLKTGQWGCCPLPKATCCSDGVHCCPNGYKCDVSTGSCSRGDSVHALVKSKSTSVTCPDGQSQCPSGSTCCKLKAGQWGCCPLPKATCCSDGVHCCPNGYKCDVSTGSCSRSGDVATVTKISACCKLPLGGVLCCKNGLVCDARSYRCVASDSPIASIPTTPSAPAGRRTSEADDPIARFMMLGASSVCNDGRRCKSEETCCTGPHGVSTCCDSPHGNCCNGGLRCCPMGFSCAYGNRCQPIGR